MRIQAIEDYINGNLTDSKARARKLGRKRLTEGLIEYGYSANTALLIIAFLLDDGSYQRAADAEYADKLARDH